MRIIGLDFETSGSDINNGTVPIQLGLAVFDEDRTLHMTSLFIGGWQWGVNASWSEEAEEVHNIPQSALNGIEGVKIVDIRLGHWLVERGVTNRMWSIPTGWNVAGFDMPFVRKYMPVVSSLLSYRTVDLNALTFGLAKGDPGRYKALKTQVKNAAAHTVLGYTGDPEPRWHDAGFDAAASLLAYHELIEHINPIEPRGRGES